MPRHDPDQATMDGVKWRFTEEKKDSFAEGVNEGYAVAERILVLWLANHTLAKPETPETLEKWSRDALAKLRELTK
jgi:hypothetical protein